MKYLAGFVLLLCLVILLLIGYYNFYLYFLIERGAEPVNPSFFYSMCIIGLCFSCIFGIPSLFYFVLPKK
jgi:hypothetical protein